MPKQRKSRSSQCTTVPPTTAQSNSCANSADAVQMPQYEAMPTETLRLLSSQRHLVQSGPRQQLIARLKANDSRASTPTSTGPAIMPDQQLASMIASIVEKNETRALLYPSHPRLSAPKLLGSTDGSTLLPFTRLYSSPPTHPRGWTYSPTSN